MRSRDPQKEAAVFDATLKLVLREGFAALKMSEVAKAAGVATGTLYVYFEDKHHLINQLYSALKRRQADAYLKGYDAAAPFMTAFEKLWRSYINAALYAPEAAAFLEQYHRSPYPDPELRRESDQSLLPFFELLERGKGERLVKDMPVQLLVIQLTGAINELVHWHHNGQIKAGPAIINKAFDLAWDSIKR